jgi:hypothetical protein
MEVQRGKNVECYIIIKIMKVIKSGLFLLFIILFSGCASSYRSIHPQIVNYQGTSISDSVKIAYKYDVLQERGNRKYAKKEFKNNMRLVAVRIENDSKKVLDFKENVKVYAGERLLEPIINSDVYDELKQSPPAHVLYLLLSPIHLLAVNFNGSPNIFPFGFIIGPTLAAWNIIISAHANAKFKYEMETYNILERKIMPGEIVYGLVCFELEDSPSLTFTIASPK